MKQAKFEQFLGTKEVICLAQASRTADRDMKTATMQLRNTEFQRIRDENKKLKRVVLGMSSGIVHLGRFDTERPLRWGWLLRGMLTYLNNTFKLGVVNEMVYDITNSSHLEDELVQLGRGVRMGYMDPTDYLGQDDDLEERIISHLISL